MAERLQKIIARAGITSRRSGEELILAGRVRVNGRIVTELGAKADPRADTIEVDGKRLVTEAPRYVVLHKPRNVVSTMSDPEGRPTVAELLGAAGSRLYPVGRLDFATSGVLLATNDGDFANGLLHPRGGVPKTYVLKVKGNMDEADLERWATGVELEDGKTLPADVRLIRHEDDKTWFEITIREGRNQQIRRMGEATGFHVMRLARTSFAGITHEGLKPGDFRSLTIDELEDLRKHYGVPKRIRGAVLGEHGEAAGRRPRPARPQHGGAGRAPQRREDRGERGGAGPRRDRPARAHDDAAPARRERPERGAFEPRRDRSTRSHEDAPPHARDRSARSHGDAPPHARDRSARSHSDAPRDRDRSARSHGDAPPQARDRSARSHGEAPRDRDRSSRSPGDAPPRGRRDRPVHDESRARAPQGQRPGKPRDAGPRDGARRGPGTRPNDGPERRRRG